MNIKPTEIRPSKNNCIRIQFEVLDDYEHFSFGRMERNELIELARPYLGKTIPQLSNGKIQDVGLWYDPNTRKSLGYFDVPVMLISQQKLIGNKIGPISINETSHRWYRFATRNG